MYHSPVYRSSYQLAAILLTAAICFTSFHALAQEHDEWEYVSHPSRIPLFDDYDTPQILPGENGVFSFSITNRYASTMANITLGFEIYMWATIKEAKPIERIRDRPKIGDSVPHGEINDTKIGVFIPLGSLPPNATADISCTIRTWEWTLEGTYFVRTQLQFDYENASYIMRSRGYWSQETWGRATTNVSEDMPGNINLTALGVDGITPDSSFGVDRPIPVWPKYLLIGLAAGFGALAALFYAMDELGKFPRLNRKLNVLWEKIRYPRG